MVHELPPETIDGEPLIPYIEEAESLKGSIVIDGIEVVEVPFSLPTPPDKKATRNDVVQKRQDCFPFFQEGHFCAILQIIEQRFIKQLLLFSILSLGVIIVAGTAYVYFVQENLLFQKATLPQDHVFSYDEPFEELFIETEKGARINALYFKTFRPKGVVLYFHGRGGNLDDRWGKFSREFTRRGYDFFIMDYRGFGKSTGKLTEKALCSDATKCYEYLQDIYPESQIVVYGRSLGTGIATFVASHKNPKMLVLESPYFSILDLIS